MVLSNQYPEDKRISISVLVEEEGQEKVSMAGMSHSVARDLSKEVGGRRKENIERSFLSSELKQRSATRKASIFRVEKRRFPKKVGSATEKEHRRSLQSSEFEEKARLAARVTLISLARSRSS